MPAYKIVPKIIAPDDVSRVFDGDCIEELARICRLPITADRSRFGDGVREAARIFARDARIPNVNQVHDEIAALWKSANPAKPPQWEAMAIALEALSPRVREILAYRGSRPGVATLLPTPKSLRDPGRREAARGAIVKLVLQGMQWAKGRSRGGGKRSRPGLAPVLFAPEKEKSPPRRIAERTFVTMLQIAWLEATGVQAVRTARRREYVERCRSSDVHRELGPFAQLVRECFRLVGLPEDVDAVERINELHHRRAIEAANK
jgi:hypothetical protein